MQYVFLCYHREQEVFAWSQEHEAEVMARLGAVEDKLKRQLSEYFYFHGLRGALLKQLSRGDAARESLTRALGLASTAAEADHIRQQLDSVS